MARPLATAYVRVRPDMSTFKSETEAGMATAVSDAEKKGTAAGLSFGSAFSKGMGRHTDKALKTWQAKVGSGLGTATARLAKVGLAAYAAVTYEVVKQGLALESSQAQVANAFRIAGQRAGDYAGRMESARSRMVKFGIDQVQTNIALATLIRGTGDAGLSIKLLGTAADLAAARGIDFQAAVKMVSMAAGGANRALKQLNVTVAGGSSWSKAYEKAQATLSDQIRSSGGMAQYAAKHHLSLAEATKLTKAAAEGSIPAYNRLGIEVLPSTATSAQRVAQFMRVMNQRVGGDAAAAANTTAGKLKAMRAQLADMAASIGEKVLPYLVRFVDWLSKSHMLIPLIVTAMGLLTAAVIAQAIAWQATPFGWIADGIAAIIVAVVLVRRYWTAIWNFMAQVFANIAIFILSGIRDLVGGILGFIGTLIHGLAVAFGGLPFMGWLKTADKAFGHFKDGVTGKLDGMIGKLRDWRDAHSYAANKIKDATGKIDESFEKTGKSAERARSDLVSYNAAIRQNGVSSDAAAKDRAKLVSDMIAAGVKAGVARKDVSDYTAAVRKNGADSDAAHAARDKLAKDIARAFQNSRQGKQDLDRYTSAVRKNGADSDAAKDARAKLIADLVASGVDARTARRLVDTLTAAIRKVQGTHRIDIEVYGTGEWSVAAQQHARQEGPVWGHGGGPTVAAQGWYVTGGTPGVDSVPVLAQEGELVVPRGVVRSGAVDHLRGRIPGFAEGGVVGSYANGVGPLGPWTVKKDSATELAIERAVASKVYAWMRTHGSTAITQFALRFLGTPYVWGGTTPRGFDCSGLTSYVYRHFGYPAPRTSQEQQRWAQPSGEVPGALAFFFGSRGAASHVGIALGGGRMVNAENPAVGTVIDRIFSGFTGFGVPPGGFDRGGWLMPGGVAINTSGKPEMVRSASEEDHLARWLAEIAERLEAVVKAVYSVAPETAAGVAGAIQGAAKAAHYASMYGA